MNTFMDLALRRQSCRSFTGEPVSHALLEKIIEAARQTPSACNSQPWRFAVAESPEAVAQVAQAGQQLGINGFLAKASAFIVILEAHAVLMQRLRVCIDSQYFARADIGAAMVSVCYAATDLGLGSCIIGLYDREKIANALDIPIEQPISALIAIGVPETDTVRAKSRKPLEEIVRYK